MTYATRRHSHLAPAPGPFHLDFPRRMQIPIGILSSPVTYTFAYHLPLFPIVINLLLLADWYSGRN